MEHPRYTSRTIEWGHWGITFMDVQPDRSKNYGKIVGRLSFAVGNLGPCDGVLGSRVRNDYLAICSRWCMDGILPTDVRGWTPEVKIQIVSE